MGTHKVYAPEGSLFLLFVKPGTVLIVDDKMPSVLVDSLGSCAKVIRMIPGWNGEAFEAHYGVSHTDNIMFCI